MSVEERSVDLAVVGAGPAGLAAAIAARDAGVRDIAVIDREPHSGGILTQCIHDGFGVIRYGESMTGPEYACHEGRQAQERGLKILTGCMVTGLSADRTITTIHPQGLVRYHAGAVILAMGCREKTRGGAGIAGTRPSGIFTAGVAQRLVNLQNIMPGRKVVILGSGDIGLIMARRLTLEGAHVAAVVERMPYPGGLPRNVVQCLDDYGIPLLLNHTVSRISGRRRVESVTIHRLDHLGRPVNGSARRIACDTLILSVGLIPENELSRAAGVEIDELTGGPIVDERLMTSVPGIFACGNVLHVHDLVDTVSEEGAYAGRSAADFLARSSAGEPGTVHRSVPVRAGSGVRYVVPGYLSGGADTALSLRVTEPMRNRVIVVRQGRDIVHTLPRVRLVPPEMIRFNLGPEAVRGAGSIEVSIDGSAV